MSKLSKRMKLFKSKVSEKIHAPLDAFEILITNAKPTESIDISFVLGINAKKSDQVVKGIVEHMPAGLGKNITIGVFTKTDVKEILAIGAEHAGFEDLFADVKAEKIDCDVYIATSDIMPELAKLGLGRILKGKMPNPKFGTVVETKDLMNAIKLQKAGKLAFRSNNNVINSSIGRASFSSKELMSNYTAFYNSIIQAKPTVIKPHNYIKKIFISSTIGPSVQIEKAV